MVSSSRKAIAFIAASAAFSGFILATPSHAQNVTRRVTAQFKGSGVSVWPAGRDTGSSLSPVLLGPSWNFGPVTAGGIYELEIPAINWGLFTTPAVPLGRTGARIDFGGSGELGLQVTPWYDGGRLDYNFQAAVSVSFPRFPAAGQQVTATAKFDTGGGSYFRTTSPEFGASFAAAFRMSGYASSEAWFLGGKLWQGNVFSPFTVGGAPKPLSGLVKFDVPNQVNDLIGLLNPLPIGASVHNPVVETYGQNVGSDGTIQAAGFGKFLSVETDILSWIALLFGGKDFLLAPLSGSYPVPGTNYHVAWDIAKAYANVDFGFYSRHTLRPRPQIRLVALNAQGQVIGEGTNSVTFTMPATSVTIVPTLTLDLDFTNLFALGTGGEIGISPFKIEATGTLGSGKHEKSIDIDFDPAKQAWTGTPSAGTKIAEETFTLPPATDGRVRTLPAIGINATDLLELPREVYGGNNTVAAEVPAYATTNESGKDYVNIYLTAEQGRRFFESNATFTAFLTKPTGEAPVRLNFGSTDDVTLELQLPTRHLVPGQHTISLRVDTRNTANQPRSATYQIPLTAYYERPLVGGQLFTQADLYVRSATNRVNADGQDKWLYISKRFVYRNTEIVIDDSIVLPNNFSNRPDQEVIAASSVGFRIPAALVQELAGEEHTIRFRNPNLRTGPNGEALPPLLSEPIKLFITAGVPKLNSVSFNDQVTSNLPLQNGGVSFELRGENFTRYTKVFATNFGGGDLPLQTEFSSPTVLRVKVPQAVMEAIHDKQDRSGVLYAQTPFRQVPAEADFPATTSGGASELLPLNFAYPAPTITRIDPSVIVRGVLAKIRVYGDNLYRQPTASDVKVTELILADLSLHRGFMSTPAANGLIVPYIDITLPITHPAVSTNGTRTLRAANHDQSSRTTTLITENGKPKLVSLNGNRIRVVNGRDYTVKVVGGPFYPESVVTLNGTNLKSSLVSITEMQATLTAAVLKAIPGSSTKAVVFTPAPGGGQSDAIEIRLEEGDPSTIKVKQGPLSFDRKSNTWNQAVTLSYGGKRAPGDVNVLFTKLPSTVTLLNGTGVLEGSPYIRVAMGTSKSMTFTATFRKTSGAIKYTPVVRFPN